MCEWWKLVPYASVCMCRVNVQEPKDNDGCWPLWSAESLQVRLSSCTQNRFSLSMWKVSLSAGPSFKPMYFIIMSLRSNRRALPSISWRRKSLEESKKRMRDHFGTAAEWKLHMHRIKGDRGIHTCFLKRSAWGASTGSICLMYCMTSSTVHRLGSWPLGFGLSHRLPGSQNPEINRWRGESLHK